MFISKRIINVQKPDMRKVRQTKQSPHCQSVEVYSPHVVRPGRFDIFSTITFHIYVWPCGVKVKIRRRCSKLLKMSTRNETYNISAACGTSTKHNLAIPWHDWSGPQESDRYRRKSRKQSIYMFGLKNEQQTVDNNNFGSFWSFVNKLLPSSNDIAGTSALGTCYI